MVTVRLFAAAAQAAGRRELAGDWAGLTAGELLQQLVAQYPGLAPLAPALSIAVNREYVEAGHRLADGDEVALIPPVSGGAAPDGAAPPPGRGAAPAGAQPTDAAPAGAPAPGVAPTVAPPFAVVQDPIDVAAVIARVIDPTVGAVVPFIGTVREWTRGRRTVHLEYEAYPEMAVQEMARIAREMEERWPGVRVAMVHRVGRLAIGEVSVVIAVGTPHRADAFAACRYAIERLKQIVPIWKKEVWEDGEEWVGAQSGPTWMHPDLQADGT